MLANDTAISKALMEFDSKKDSTILLITEHGFSAAEFIGKARKNFDKSYIVDCSLVDIKNFSGYVIDTMFGEDKVFTRKMMQLISVNSGYNGKEAELIMLLDKIAKLDMQVLLSFMHLEKLSASQTQSVAYIIRHAPENLRVIIHATQIPNLEPNCLGTINPILLTRTDLGDVSGYSRYKSYFSGLSMDKIALLTYIRRMPLINDAIINSYMPGVDLTFLKELKDSEDYRCFVMLFDNFYVMSGIAADVLDAYEVESRNLYPELFAKNPLEKLAGYFTVNMNYAYEAFNTICLAESYDRLEYISSYLAKHAIDKLTMLCSAILGDDYRITLTNQANMPFYSAIYAHQLAKNGKHSEALDILLNAYEHFCKISDLEGLCLSVSSIIRLGGIFGKTTDVYKKHVGVIMDGLRRIKNMDAKYYNWVFCLAVRLRTEIDTPISIFYKAIETLDHKESPMYLFNMEGLMAEYQKIGNYRQMFIVVDEIKRYLPAYIVPYEIMFSKYYLGDVDEALSMAVNAEEFAKINELKFAKTHLHALMGIINFYYGKKEKGFECIDEGLKEIELSKKKEDRITYYRLLSVKLCSMIKYGETVAVKHLARAYVEYCKVYEPWGLPYMQSVLAFACKRMGEFENAYQCATQSIASSTTKNASWLISMGIATAYMLKNNDLKDAVSLVRNIFNSGELYGMDMVFVDYYDEIFDCIVNYAQINGVTTDYIEKIIVLYEKKNQTRTTGANFSINMFGEVVITSCGRTVQWKTRKSRDLFLLYLMAGESGIDRATIIDYLWNGYLYESAINNLKTTNNIIRNTLKSCGVKFDLEYINTKYMLRISNIYNDYDELRKLLDSLKDESNGSGYLDIINKVLAIYKGDFATDLEYPEFEDERNTLKHDVRMALVTAVRNLEREGDLLEAKRILTALIRIDRKFDYSHMQSMIDSRLGF